MPPRNKPPLSGDIDTFPLQARSRLAVHRSIPSVGTQGNPGGCMLALYRTWSTGGK